MRTSIESHLPKLGPWIVVIGCLLYGFSLPRVPQFSVDEAFFAYPALKATLGGTLTYAASQNAPFGDTIWAYHGPVLPNLDELLFRIFGFSNLVSRLPDFLGGWLAAFVVVLFLNRKGFRYAGFAFAVLWCGDFSVQLLNLGRMEGLALLAVVASFLWLDRALTTGRLLHFFLSGVACGLAALIHPLCIVFALVELCLCWLLGARKAIPVLIGGGSLSIPALLFFWHFQVRESFQQFRWHSSHLQQHDRTQALMSMMQTVDPMHWAWIIGLSIFSLLSGFTALAVLWNRKSRLSSLDPQDRTIVLSAAMGLGALLALYVSPLISYYLIYLSIWPILCAVMLADRHWVRFRPVAFVLGLLWLFSAAGSAIRLWRTIRYYPSFNQQFLYATIRDKVPPDALIVATPRLYSVPLNAGYKRFGLTTWFKEQEDACPRCYLLMSEPEFQAANLVVKANIEQRKVLYDGPAFPASSKLKYPVVLLSPELLPSGAFRTDGPLPR